MENFRVFLGILLSEPPQSLQMKKSIPDISLTSGFCWEKLTFANQPLSNLFCLFGWLVGCLFVCSSNFWHDTLRLHPSLGTNLHINRLLRCTSQLNKQSDPACLKQMLDGPVPSWILGWFAFSTYKSTSFT